MSGLHVFEAYGETFMIHGDTSALFRVSPLAHDYLGRVESGSSPEEAWRALEERYPPGTLPEFRSSLDDLVEGLRHLSSQPAYTSEQAIQALLRHNPRNIMLFITNVCNLRCSYCYERYPGRKFTPLHLTEREVCDVIDEYTERAGGRSPITVTFFGGEPLLNFEVLKAAVEYCKGKERRTGREFFFCVTTNATVMTDEMTDFLVRHQFGVMASIDGPQASHDRYRKFANGRGSYRRVSANIKKLLARQLEKGIRPVKLRATLTKENYHEYDAVDRFFQEEFPGARIMIGETTGTVEFVNEWDVPLADTEFQRQWFDEFRQEILEAPLEEVGVLFRDQMRAMEETHRKLHTPKTDPHLPQICGVGRNMLAVSSDGNYYPCHRFIGMENFVLGSTRKGLCPDSLKRFYAKLIRNYEEHCSSCWARTLCGGDCPAYLGADDGSFRPPPPERCSSLRRSYELNISIYFSIKEQRPDIFQRYIAGAEGPGE
jgi:uncharacterized protein